MCKEVKYIGFYDLPNSKYRRVATLAATNKMDYICDSLNRAGYKVHLISPSWFDDSAADALYQPQTTIELTPKIQLTLCPSIGTSAKWTRNIKILFSLVWLFLWVATHVERNEKVLMYHTPWLSIPVRLAKWAIGFELILEVEEVYSDVSVIHQYFIELENQLFAAANYFLFASELLAERICRGRQFVIIYGSYKTNARLSVAPKDGKIHLLYAGIIDSHKAGAFNAIECAGYLPENYVLHIIGFGETDKLLKRIREINNKSRCKIYYDGTKNGDEYIIYSQSCHIGLSTQKMSGKYLETSFPSKILSYLSMGLSVVSCKIECVLKSQIGPYMTYYDDDSPESIAQAILKVKLHSGNSNWSDVLKELDRRFTYEIQRLLELN